MILLAPHIAAFLQQRLPIERRASPNTCDSYAHAFRLLFEYASACVKLPPSQLQLEQLDAPLIVNFLNHLETSRGNGAGSRNIRLAAIKSFMHYDGNISRYCRRRWSRSNGFWPSLQKRRTPGFVKHLRLPRRCNRSWMPLTQLSGTASVTGRCFTFASRVDCGSLLNWWDLRIEDMIAATASQRSNPR